MLLIYQLVLSIMAMGLKSKAGNRNGVTMDNQMNQYDNGGA